MNVFDDAEHEWQAGEPLKAGLRLEASVPPKQAVLWATRVIRRLSMPPVLAVEILTTLDEPSRWRSADSLFEKVRRTALSSPDTRWKPVEHALKLAFNTAGGTPSYDPHQFARFIAAVHRGASGDGADLQERWNAIAEGSEW